MTGRNAPLIVASVIASVSVGASLIAALTIGPASASGAAPHDDVSPTPSITLSLTPPAPTVTVTKTVTAKPTPTNTKPILHLSKTIHVQTRSANALPFSSRREVVTVLIYRGGRDSGRGVETCLRSSSSATTFVCKTAFALKGGIITFSATVNLQNGTVNGTVTGGSGNFAGARGTVKGSAAKSGHGSNIAISYYT